MALKAIVDSLADVPQQFHELYTEKNGKYELTGVEGFRTQGDIDRLTNALNKERNDHKATKEKFSVFGDRKPEEIIALLDRIPELEAAAAGKIDDQKIDAMVENRIKTKLAPVERERDQLRSQVKERDDKLGQYEQKDRTRAIHDAVRSAATAAKVLPEALEDALMLAERVFDLDETGKVITKDNSGATPGIEANVWFSELQTKRPHWWPASGGGGAGGNRNGGGGAGPNPWSHDGWNMTEQSRIYKESPSRAEQLAKSAGTVLGGSKPLPKK